MSREPFPGFPARSSFTPLPDAFFSAVVPEIDNLLELKVILKVFWRLYRKKGSPRFVTLAELMEDKRLLDGLDATDHPSESLAVALESAAEHGILLRFGLLDGNRRRDAYVINNLEGRAVLEKFRASDAVGYLSSQARAYGKREKPKIFALYEKNVGLLTPMIAEELKEAEGLYPEAWIEEAFGEAVSLNKRNWRYIARILERWSVEGRDSGEPGRSPKKDKYVKGKYGHLVRH